MANKTEETIAISTTFDPSSQQRNRWPWSAVERRPVFTWVLHQPMLLPFVRFDLVTFIIGAPFEPPGRGALTMSGTPVYGSAESHWLAFEP
jgi:hypothetical protein